MGLVCQWHVHRPVAQPRHAPLVAILFFFYKKGTWPVALMRAVDENLK
jgi:hypothetical protein